MEASRRSAGDATGLARHAPPRQPQSWTDLGPRLASAAVIIAIIATGLYFGGYVAALAAIVFGVAYRDGSRW